MFVRFTQDFGYIRLSLCRRHLKSFMSVTQKLFGSTLGAQKMCYNELPSAARLPRQCLVFG